VFDLDGTLTRHDTLLAYLTGYLRRHPQGLARVWQVLPVLALKSAAIRAVLGGRTRAELGAWTGEFVSQFIPRDLHRDALLALEQHRRAGDRLVLLSASPDLYVPEIGRALGFAQTVCTGVAWEGERLTGRLTTPNRRGVEKAHCLAALRREHPGLEVVAYGNAASDLDHLVLADHGTLVNGSVLARRAAAELGLAWVTWH
jgi:phosphatidylglycerophosphatase C